VPPALLSLCEWWVGLSAEERSKLLAAAEWAEIDRQVDAAVLGKATWTTTSTFCPIEPTFFPADEEGQP
jgi:hypothetical protein